jgi:glycosyltransferase involved in cell wall biosynthesis
MVVHAYYPLAEPRVEREAQAARGAGYRVHVIALRNVGEPRHEVVDGVEVHRAGIRHVRAASIGRMLFEYLGFLLRSSWMTAALFFRRGVRTFHIHAPPDFLIFAGVLPRMLGSRLILDIHDLSPDMYEARLAGSRYSKIVTTFLRMIERLACTIAHHVITVHEPYREELIRHGVALGKISVVMNSPDEALIERVKARAAARADAFTVAYHGTVNHWYGVDVLVKAVAILRERLPGVRALVLGDGDALPEVQKLSEELGLAGEVEFSGRYLPIEEALAGVAAADVGVIPNQPSPLNRFALSTKLFEYVALGIPVAVSRLETLARHFSADEVTFFTPADPRALADALQWTAEHPAEARQKAARAAGRARQYAWRANRELYMRILAPDIGVASASAIR